MSDVNANIGVQIDTSQALAELKSLQRQLAVFYSSISKSSAAAVNAQRNLQLNLLSSINASGKFAATIGSIRTSTESFTHALENNKLSMREYSVMPVVQLEHLENYLNQNLTQLEKLQRIELKNYKHNILS